jgi:hypothetical protein
MPIQRPLDFFTSMGPGDVLLAGHIDYPAGPPDRLRVTPRECSVEYSTPGAGQYRYSVTLPGKGSLDIAGVCTAFQPTLADDDFRQIVHSYDRDTRTIEFRILEQPGPPPAAPDEVELQAGERLYFWVHLYDSAPQRPNLVIEAP